MMMAVTPEARALGEVSGEGVSSSPLPRASSLNRKMYLMYFKNVFNFFILLKYG